MAQPALIFIPDISGFTRFVTRTEIQHATHIISELVSVILESNRLDLALSEIEGDAVLFYRTGAPPSTEELVDQARTMFVEFHRYLKIIHRDAVCQCGACTTASGLSLKFIAHYGELDEVRIREFLKLMGQDVILAHRLLKNDVPSDEYVLMTDPLLDAQGLDTAARGCLRLTPHQEHVPEFGDVPCAYVGLTPLLSTVPDPPHRRALSIGAGVTLCTNIRAPATLVHDYVTNMDKRASWAERLKDIVGGEPINRVGDSHTCVFDDLEVHVVTLDHQTTDDGFHYTESGDTGRGLVLLTDYRGSEREGVTTLTVTMGVTPPDPVTGPWRSLVQRFRAGVFLHFGKRSLARSLQTLQSRCERASMEQETLPTGKPQIVGL